MDTRGFFQRICYSGRWDGCRRNRRMKKTVALTNWSVICLKPWRHYCYLDLAIKQSKLPEEAEKKGKTQLNPEKLRIKVCLCPFLLSNLCRLYNFILTGALIVHLKSWKQHLLYLFLFHMHNQRLVLWLWKFIFTFQLNQSHWQFLNAHVLVVRNV